MIQKYIILLEKYLHNQLTYEERIHFENKLIQNVQFCEQLKASSSIPDHVFLKMYQAIKAKNKYQIQTAS